MDELVTPVEKIHLVCVSIAERLPCPTTCEYRPLIARSTNRPLPDYLVIGVKSGSLSRVWPRGKAVQILRVSGRLSSHTCSLGGRSKSGMRYEVSLGQCSSNHSALQLFRSQAQSSSLKAPKSSSTILYPMCPKLEFYSFRNCFARSYSTRFTPTLVSEYTCQFRKIPFAGGNDAIVSAFGPPLGLPGWQ